MGVSFEDLPAAQEPVYDTPMPNVPIRLYTGNIELVQGVRTCAGTGEVRMEWPPRPSIVVDFSLEDNSQLPEIGPAQLAIPELEVRAEVRVDGLTLSGGERASPPCVTCSIHKAVSVGEGETLSYLLFHVPNFHGYPGLPTRQGEWATASRAVLEAAGWRVVLDHIRRPARTFMDRLKSSRGHAITHIGRLERASGGTFSSDDTRDVMMALSYFLSFCRGNWVAPLLSVGFDSSGEGVWKQWGPARAERWAGVRSWFSEFSLECLTEPFAGFAGRWSDPNWREPLRLAIHWYIGSNLCSGGVEGALILAQVGFELISWALLVVQRPKLTKRTFRRKSAAEKLRLLLRECGIGLEIPESLDALRKTTRNAGPNDGPAAITRVRNAIVHPEPTGPKAEVQQNVLVRYEAWRLALWYLELVILSILGYKGKYSSRVSTAQWRGDEVELVPWSQRQETCGQTREGAADTPGSINT